VGYNFFEHLPTIIFYSFY